jgi:hypothetical protein
MSLSRCQECNSGYRRDKLKNCPSCGAVNDFLGASPSSTSINSQSTVNASFDFSGTARDSNIEKLIAAQNRTTYAVRAFVRFLFIQLSSVTLGVILWNLSNTFGGNKFLQITAVITILVGLFWSSNAGWSELGKSKIR